MKYLLTLLIVSCIVVTGSAQVTQLKEQPKKVEETEPVPPPLPMEEPEPNPNAPEFKFEKEVHNFGEVPEGPRAAYEFVFTNVGKEPLIIKRANATCGCTIPSWPREPILPGQSEKIRVVFTTQGKPGIFNKKVTILSNAKTSPKYIRIKGKVIPKAKTTTGAPVKSKPKHKVINEAPVKEPAIIQTPKK